MRATSSAGSPPPSRGSRAWTTASRSPARPRPPADQRRPAPRRRWGRGTCGYPRRSMFEALSDRFDGIFTKLRGKGRLSDEDVDEVLREIRLALLEADVNFKVVKNFVARVREDLVGMELSKALNPAQQVVKAVHDELISTLGG